MNPTEPSTTLPKHHLVILSDLHLGEGLIPDPPRYSPMEDFFYDQAFERLLQHLRQIYPDPASLLLVFNGDILDFLTVTRVPDAATCAELGWTITNSEQRFGLVPTPEKSLFKLDAIVSGHPVFFKSLAHFIAAGYRLEFLRGNHDLEVFFEQVQRRFCEHLTLVPGGPTAEQAQERVRFHQWFYLEPGRVYIEHGNQYEASNSIRYPLRPVLPPRKHGEQDEVLLDYPLGSLFVRYFYNRVHRLDPYTPKVISFEQYLDFIRRYNVLDLLRVAKDHYPFFVSALTPEGASGRTRDSTDENAVQKSEFQALQESSQPVGFYQQLNELKIVPKASSKLMLVNEMLKPIMRRLIWIGAMAIGSLYLWLLIFNLIQVTTWLAENVFLKSTLLVFFSVATLVALFWAGTNLGRKLRRRTDTTVETCVERADRIARLTNAPLVLMGHTHVVDQRKVADGKAIYANSGTWTSVDNPWKNHNDNARRMTFLLVKGDQVMLSVWNDNAGRIDPAPLFDIEDDSQRQRNLPDPVKP